MTTANRASSIWKLTRDRRMLDCVLRGGVGTPIAISITIDGTEIAARTCVTRVEATAYAAFLFDRLTEAGWSVRAGLNPTVLH